MSGRYGYRLISRTTPPKSPWGNGRHAHQLYSHHNGARFGYAAGQSFSGPDGARKVVRFIVSVGRRPLHTATVQNPERWANRVLDVQRLDAVCRDV
jgi:hypothetical protein